MIVLAGDVELSLAWKLDGSYENMDWLRLELDNSFENHMVQKDCWLPQFRTGWVTEWYQVLNEAIL